MDSDFVDVVGKLVFYPNDPIFEKYKIKLENSIALDECKSRCKSLDRCVFVQYRKTDSLCGYYTLLPSSNFFQWHAYDRPIISYSLPYNTTQINIQKSYGTINDCHELCQNDINCLYSITSISNEQKTRKEICNRYNAISNNDYILSYYKEAEEKLHVDRVNTNDTMPFQEPISNDMDNGNPYFGKDEGIYNMNSSILYGLTIVILVLIAIILFICKRRSDNEKMLLYTISNMTANSQSQSRSRSKSSPSENLSFKFNKYEWFLLSK